MMRKFVLSVAGILVALGVPTASRSVAAEVAAEPEIKELLLYVGTYTFGESKGIYIYRMDLSSGELKSVGVRDGVVSPSFLAFGPGQSYLYAVNEISNFAGKPGGAVAAFRIDRKTGGLTFLNQQPSGGASPCHLSVDKKGKFVVVANYSGGCVSVIPIEEGGQLGKPTDLVRHEGSSVNPRRQQGPHPHSVNLDPADRYVFVPDLGLDKIMIYKVDLTQGKLTPNDEPWAKVEGGAGPRHFDFHPNGRYAYVINELNSTVTAFAYDKERGTLREFQTVSTLPADFEGRSTCADVHVSPSGEFLYGSNRGHDSIVIYAIDGATGKLRYVGCEPTQGKTPRNFAIDPTGKFLLAANQDSSTVVTYRIDPATGKLKPTGQVVKVPMPVCLKMMPLLP